MGEEAGKSCTFELDLVDSALAILCNLTQVMWTIQATAFSSINEGYFYSSCRLMRVKVTL